MMLKIIVKMKRKLLKNINNEIEINILVNLIYTQEVI